MRLSQARSLRLSSHPPHIHMQSVSEPLSAPKFERSLCVGDGARHAQLQQCDGQYYGSCDSSQPLGHPAIGTVSELARRLCCIVHGPLVHPARVTRIGTVRELASAPVSACQLGGSGRIGAPAPTQTCRCCSAAKAATLLLLLLRRDLE